jgi:hypothetical protein
VTRRPGPTPAQRRAALELRRSGASYRHVAALRSRWPIVGIVVFLVAFLAFWAAVAFVLVHFLAKAW